MNARAKLKVIPVAKCFTCVSVGKESPAMRVLRPGFDPWIPRTIPLEKGMATHSSILAWRIPWTVYGPWT